MFFIGNSATLYRTGKEKLRLTKAVEEPYIYELVYTQTYKDVRSSETPVTVTRQVKLSFLAENDWLGRVELSVREEFPV